jgi:hypothetical protein
MKSLGIALVPALVATASVAHAAPQPRAAACPLTITFASYAMGIDGTAFAAVDRLLRRDRGVRAVARRNWGREGEVTLCVRTRSKSDARRLFARVKTLFPARPRGPLTVETAGGLKFYAPRD